MLPVWIWLRRSATLLASPALLAGSVVMLFSRSGWEYEWNWALSNATTPSVLMSPLVAGLVAYDRSRNLEPTLAEIGRGTRRPGIVPLAVASWMICLTVWLCCLAVAAFWAQRHGATGTPDPWIFLQGPVVMGASVGFGLLWGARFAGVVAPAFCVVVVYLVGILASVLGVPQLFAAGRATGSLIGLEQVPLWAGLGVAASALVTVGGVLGAASFHQRSRAHAAAALMLFTAAAAVAIAAGVRVGGNTYRAVAGSGLCIEGPITVCGPSDGGAVLTIAQRDLTSAMERLASSDIEWRRHYEWVRGDDVLELEESAGLLRVDPESIEDGRTSPADIAATLSMPRLCREFFDDAPPEGLLAKQQLVHDWVSDALSATSNTTQAPADVVAAYEDLSTCPIARRR